MATGALDANGIWQYGEDDSETTFSGLLNKLASSTSATVTRLEGFTGFTGTVPTANLPTIPINKGGTGSTGAAGARQNLGVGLVPIVPSSVTAVGTSATVSTTGRVTMTTLTSITLNDVFSATYQSYLVIWEQNARSADGDVYLQFTTGGTASTGNYNGGVIITGGTVAGLNQSNTTHNIVHTNTASGGFSMNVYYPANDNVRTSFTANSYAWQTTAANNKNLITGGFQNSTTAHDGFKITAAGGASWSGGVSVFGYIR